uniref:Uncharacterized protein n=1 Tax=Picea glauca TaxID=3330 RepID=A0A101M229_PICGL|nr:hypothetical protein ABT39_MTgene4038 [Picea glauca]
MTMYFNLIFIFVSVKKCKNNARVNCHFHELDRHFTPPNRECHLCTHSTYTGNREREHMISFGA